MTLRQNHTEKNWRFYASGGVCPQKHLCEFGSVSPARTFVNPRLREAATTIVSFKEMLTDAYRNKRSRGV